jgi:hypothetical protein
MTFYYPSSHYDSNYRSQLFPLLKPFIKGEGFTDKARKATYGVSETDYDFMNSISNAEVVILTMSWNYYVKTNRLNVAIDLIKKAAEENKEVWSYNSGDFGVKIPSFYNLKVFRFSGYVSKNQIGNFGMPAIIGDYLKEHYTENMYKRKFYDVKPTVGFCGQADSSFIKGIKEQSRTLLRNLKSYLGLRSEEAQALISTTNLRATLLVKLKKSPLIKSEFIKRKKYRAGVINNKAQHQTTEEFYDNILASDYVLCVRGGGNFSVRFYETLMMGRIPLYIHTDGFLPLDKEIDWKKHVVWVDYCQIDKIDKILVEFHQNLNQDKLQKLFKSNRKLWENKLRLDGFFKSMYDIKIK